MEEENKNFSSMIQGYTPNPDLTRTTLNELGRKGPYFRYINFPVEISKEFGLMTLSQAQVVKPPYHEHYRPEHLTVFLAGSIEMGVAEPWQERLTYLLQHVSNLTIFNPRRDAWDSSWKQEKGSPQFEEQVLWEIEKLEASDVAIFYFDPNTKSPVTLLELGLTIGKGDKDIIVCCPKGFWRKGNVDIVCDLNNIPQVNTVDDLAEEIVRLVWANDRYKDKTNETHV